MNRRVLVAGGGIGGLACALSLGRAGVPVTVLEQAESFGEVGAGVQLGPNAVRVLSQWGLTDALQSCAAFPDALRVRDAGGGGLLGQLRLGPVALARYGQPYATVHRADLHAMLLGAVRARTPAELVLGARLQGMAPLASGVSVALEDGQALMGDALVGCDGVWSRVRAALLGDAPAAPTGHLAYRGLVPTRDLPPALRTPVVTAWLGPRLHVVHYPVRRGEAFNVVVVVQAAMREAALGPVDPRGWYHEAGHAELRALLGAAHADLLGMIEAVPQWSLWALHDRAPMAGPGEHASGRVALLGDAAHPMRPYLAQGAAMALEDAWTLGKLVDRHQHPIDWPGVFERYAALRWRRNARVQAQSRRNGSVFHATGLVRWGRNSAMALLRERLLDNPWLYGGPPKPEPQP